MKIAYFVMKYPTPSQTFIEREMLGLAANGLQIEVHPCLDFRPAARPAATAGWLDGRARRAALGGCCWRC